MNEEQSMSINKQVQLDTVHSLFVKSWEIFTKHIKDLALIGFISGAGSLVLTAINGFGKGQSHSLLSFVVMLGSIILGVWGGVALYLRVTKLDTPMSIGQAFDAAKSWILPMLWVGILTAVATSVGYLLLIIPGIIFTVWFTFSYFVVLEEQQRGVSALKTSKKYVAGYWFEVFGRMFALFVVVTVGLVLFGLLVYVITKNKVFTSLLVNLVTSMVILPYSIIYQSGLFHNLKRIKTTASQVN